MSNLDSALKMLREASDAQLKKLYVKKVATAMEPNKKEEEEELSEEDAELLKKMLDEE